MIEYLSVIVGFLVLALLLGLGRILLGPSSADRMLASQLFSTAGVSILILLAIIQNQSALINVALVLALLAPLTLITFIRLRKKSL
ncbi:monovalent cation/H+ antiporter complex subunit F [Marinobacter psychrophilus]|jgi:multicomponent Na+:H+ antiporter subunit F|uniref:monovalent cation/H+ antiporter complex subunit F n=1 Tax=Marinobacter psychrophilus TaxID=330734 RepID=UPI001B6A7D3F|nr:monovalent cation/H+ antiporter complex subunit F [Marinobacter psychrophilus]MBQ0763153.1 multiple resistance and pH regulation protein F [Marinobacter psychrophilus]MBQ0843956.1 multiple resistance and pH regulation protein F [Marinobacter psychrophilus]